MLYSVQHEDGTQKHMQNEMVFDLHPCMWDQVKLFLPPTPFCVKNMAFRNYQMLFREYQD